MSGLIISIAMGLAKGSFDGSCPLYMEFQERNKVTFVNSYGTKTSCDFVIYFPVVGLILYPFAMFALYFYVFFRVFTGTEEAMKYIKKIPILIINCVVFFLLLVTACMLSTGRSNTCSSYENAHSFSKVEVTCYSLEMTTWTNETYDTSKLITHIVLAEVTAWVCHIWVILLILPTAVEMWKMFRNSSRT